MTLREMWRHLRYRWPAIRSILRDGTVVYRATIDDGTLVVRRANSAVMDLVIIWPPNDKKGADR